MTQACARAGVCPRLLVTPWAGGVIAAKAWWEQGELGLSFLEAPAWLHQAFGVVGREAIKAMKLRGEIERNAK